MEKPFLLNLFPNPITGQLETGIYIPFPYFSLVRGSFLPFTKRCSLCIINQPTNTKRFFFFYRTIYTLKFVFQLRRDFFFCFFLSILINTYSLLYKKWLVVFSFRFLGKIRRTLLNRSQKDYKL